MTVEITSDQIAKLVTPKLSKYTPHTPFAKQMAFLMLPQDEALYGGALGGGKSDCALMAALQYVHVPNYSALILRKTIADLKQSGALLDRMQQWMMPYTASKEIKYEAQDRKYRFPTYDKSGKRLADAVIQFGYIGHNSNAFTRYQGIEIQYCCFDEITQHAERDYEYLFTRLRKCVCPVHTERDANQDPIYHDDCQLCSWVRSIPIRMRATCNPDGVGFAWVKKRWNIQPNMTEDEAKDKGEKVKWIGNNPERPFLPASYKDNPYLDHKAYEQRMRKKLSDDTYEALMEGSWGVLANARFKKKWERKYSTSGELIYLGPNLSGKILDQRTDIQEIFMTVDSASTSVEGPGDIDLFPSKVVNPSWSVISTWMLTNCYNLLWLNMLRFREEIPEVIAHLKEQYEVWKPSVAIVEENGVGKGVSQIAERIGIPVKGLHKDTDKVVNATEAIVQMKAGRIWTPWHGAAWLTEVHDEVFTWQGHPQETDDIVDTLAHAANHVDWSKAGEAVEYTHTHITEISVAPTTCFPIERYRPIGLPY